MFVSLLSLAAASLAEAAAVPELDARQAAAPVVNQTTCNGQTYVYQQLAGFGSLPSNARDKFGDTIGGIGSSIQVDRRTWVKQPSGGYSGILYAIPDRGWNTEGTLNYQGRVHKFLLSLTPEPNATVAKPSGPNVNLTYLDTTLLTGPDLQPTTGLDGDPSGHLSYFGFPDLPIATYTGNGFGGAGPGGKRIPVDDEGLVVAADGSYWISDEYGPYIYHYSIAGNMVEAIRPPTAFVPMRNGTESFSADSPAEYATGETDDVTPADPDTGRENNHGFEGLTMSPDQRNLYVLLQDALVQDGGTKSSTEFYIRMLHYDISSLPRKLVGEYVVHLPTYAKGKKPNTAGQSEFHFISPTQFLVLSRDSGAGRGQSSTTSLYRHADVFDISNATNILGSYDAANGTVAPAGVLNAGVTPATYCPWLDYNVNSQLNRFGVHNGGAQDAALLDEKWESLSLVPVNPGVSDDEWFLFSMADNDFITQDGHLNFGRFNYSDASGFNVDTQILAFQVKLPTGSNPF